MLQYNIYKLIHGNIVAWLEAEYDIVVYGKVNDSLNNTEKLSLGRFIGTKSV